MLALKMVGGPQAKVQAALSWEGEEQIRRDTALPQLTFKK